MRASRYGGAGAGIAAAMTGGPNNLLGGLAAAWAIAGWAGVLLFAIVRLSRIAAEALADELTPAQLAVLLVNLVVMAWTEGYRGFQLKFSPRAAARVLYLRRHADWRMTLLAPFFCVGYYRASPRVRRMTWLGTMLIVLLIIIVHQLPQPWRGIVDAGVVLGLTWGLVSFLALSGRALVSGAYPAEHQVREPAGVRTGL